MRAVLVALILSGCADEGPVAWLEVAGFDGSIRVEGHGGDVLSVGGFLVTRQTLSKQLGFRLRDTESGMFHLLHDARMTRVRVVAEPTLRTPRLRLAASKRRGALLVEIDRQRDEDGWTMFIGAQPASVAVGCTTVDGSWVRCDR
jgi:hypothetical protein